MKKKLIGALAAVLVVGMLGGCSAEETTVLKDMDVDKYVTLGEYKGLQVTVEPIEVTEEDINAWVDEVYFNALAADFGGVTDRAVEVGDTVSIDYVGMKDGVAFSGGTAQNQPLTIGSGSYIPGFEDGLVGVMPGETVDLNLTFPDSYGSADLAGQAVVFTVTVNFIVPEEKSDEIIATLGMENVYTEEALYEFARDYLTAYYEQAYASNVRNAVMDAFMQTCVFKDVPQALVDKHAQASRESITLTAANSGMTADDYTYYLYGVDMETYIVTYSEPMAKLYIAIQAVANKENLNISDEELDQMLLEQAQLAGFVTIEDYLGQTDKEDAREYFMYDKVWDFLVDNAVVSQ